MEARTLEITLHYAKDLNKVNLITKMDVYAVVTISGGDKNSNQKTKSPVDHDGDANPTWDFPMKFTVEEGALQQNRLTLEFKLVCERALGDKDVGEVNVPIKELFDSPTKGEGKRFLSYQVRKPSGKPKGQLTFSYLFSEITTAPPPNPHPAEYPLAPPPPPVKGDGEPLTAYPAGHSSPYPPPQQGLYPPPPPYTTAVSAEGGGHYPPPPVGYPSAGSAAQPGGGYPPPPPGSGYPPPPPGSGYPPPPPPQSSSYAYPPQSSSYAYPPQSSSYAYPPQPSSYGYPPQSSSYGYPPQPGYGYPPPPVQQPPKKNNKFGMGLGAGLLGGAIGGLLVGDMISDASDFDCGGGFDF